METIRSHKEKCIQNFKAKAYKSPQYDYDKLVSGIQCEESDCIPKVPDAGKVVREGNSSYQIMHNGVKVMTDCCNWPWLSDLICGLKGHHEPQEERVFHEILKFMPPKATMIELGSGWSYYSLWFNEAVQDATNYMIEPDPERLESGKNNFRLNQKEGHFTRAYLGGTSFDGSANYAGALQISIDSFIRENGIERVNILHCDIQGYEYQMLVSARESIEARKIDYFFISTHSDSQIHAPCMQYLHRSGYTILAEHTMAESFSADGLIVARRKELEGPDEISISKREPYEPK
ncbi:MAG: FkbM family methyltransferase [Verrucomicrobia bacterium]|nr:FkbM family methyltransferase [Verrucomicrobiota bacterium]